MAYSGPVTDPFRRKAPDGRTYFDILNPPKGIVQVYQLTYADIAQRQRYAITPGISSIEKAYWESTALRLSRAITQFEERLAALAIRTAAVADASIRRHIDQTQVRADTSKQRHMRDNIRSRHVPLPGVAEAGVVGIADMSELNKTARGAGPIGTPRSSAPTPMSAAPCAATSCPVAPARRRRTSGSTRSSRPPVAGRR
jgi:hypothetical protein